MREQDLHITLVAFRRSIAVIIGSIWAWLVSSLVWRYEARRELRAGLSECVALRHRIAARIQAHAGCLSMSPFCSRSWSAHTLPVRDAPRCCDASASDAAHSPDRAHPDVLVGRRRQWQPDGANFAAHSCRTEEAQQRHRRVQRDGARSAASADRGASARRAFEVIVHTPLHSSAACSARRSANLVSRVLSPSTSCARSLASIRK
jgi:hypothetical protein